MDKNKVLQQAKSHGLDEREQNIFLSSLGFSSVITAILCFLLVIVNQFKGEDYTDCLIIALGSLSAMYFYQYKYLKNSKLTLASAILNAFVALLFFIAFLLG